MCVWHICVCVWHICVCVWHICVCVADRPATWPIWAQPPRRQTGGLWPSGAGQAHGPKTRRRPFPDRPRPAVVIAQRNPL